MKEKRERTPQKEIAYLRRKISRLELQQQRQERLTDINHSLLIRSNAELEEALILAEQASQAKTDFLANISHEIRTPLNIILGMGEVLADTELNAFQHDHLATLQESGRQLLGILNNVLDLSRIESGTVAAEAVPFSIRTLLEELQLAITPLALQKDLRYTSSISRGVADQRRGDPVKIRQVLFNILSNAVKFTEQGSINLRAENSEALSAPAVVFHIADTGLGMSEAEQAIIFERFSQGLSSHSNSRGGVGLGLAISKRLVEILGGDITVESAQGEGTTFSITLPLAISEAPAELGEEAAAPEYTPRDLAGINILIVEDVEENYTVLRQYLAGSDARLTHVRDGIEALSSLYSSSYDLVLMDIRMPILDGMAATREIRNRPSYGARNLPIIAMTAHAFEEQRTDYLREGFNEVLPKPFSKHDLLEILYNYIPSPHGAGRSGGNAEKRYHRVPESLQPLTGQVVNRLREYMRELAKILTVDDRERKSDLCHSARGLSGMYKLLHMSVLIEHISMCIKRGKTQEARQIIKYAERHLSELEEEYRPYFSN